MLKRRKKVLTVVTKRPERKDHSYFDATGNSSDSSHPDSESSSPVNVRKRKIAAGTSSTQPRAGRDECSNAEGILPFRKKKRRGTEGPKEQDMDSPSQEAAHTLIGLSDAAKTKVAGVKSKESRSKGVPGSPPVTSRKSSFTRKRNLKKILLKKQSIDQGEDNHKAIGTSLTLPVKESDFSEQHTEKEGQQTQFSPTKACSLLSCNQQGSTDEFGRKVSYHTFPEKLDIRIKWLVKIRIGQDKFFSPSKAKRICSKHFRDEDFCTSTLNNRCRLKPSAIPTVFTKVACSHTEELDSSVALEAATTFTKVDSSHNVKSESETVLENIVIKTEPLYPVSLWEEHSSETLEGNSDPLPKNTPVETVLLSTWDAFEPENPNIKVEVETENNSECASSQPVICDCSIKIEKLEEELKQKDEIIKVKDSYLAKLVDCASNYEAIKEELEKQELEMQNLKKENAELQERNSGLCFRVYGLVNEIVSYKTKCTELQKQINPKPFSLDVIRERKGDVFFYTGLSNFSSLMAVFDYLDPGSNGENIKYWNTAARYNPPKESVQNQFLMVLLRLRLGLMERDLAQRFHVTKVTVNRILTTWINFLYFRLGQLPIWPTRKSIEESMSPDFKKLYPTTRVIVGTMNFKCDTPYFKVESSESMRALIGLTPNGFVSFVSSLFPGNTSDSDLLSGSGLLNMDFAEGDTVMVDQNFQLSNELIRGVKTPMVIARENLTVAQMKSRKLFYLKFLIAKRTKLIKNFHIFDKPFVASSPSLSNQIWTCCALLSNFQRPISCEA